MRELTVEQVLELASKLGLLTVTRCSAVATEQQYLGASDIGFEVQQVKHEIPTLIDALLTKPPAASGAPAKCPHDHPARSMTCGPECAAPPVLQADAEQQARNTLVKLGIPNYSQHDLKIVVSAFAAIRREAEHSAFEKAAQWFFNNRPNGQAYNGYRVAEILRALGGGKHEESSGDV